MNTFVVSFELLGKNLKSIIYFEISYKIMCIALFTPILFALFNLSLHLAGYNYLSSERLFSYLISPFTIAFLLIIGVLITAISLLDMSAIIKCHQASYSGKTIHVTEMYHSGLLTMKKLMTGQNFLLVLFLVIIVPFTNITLISGYIGSITIPAFILEYIKAHLWSELAVGVFYIILLLFSIRWCLSIHCFVLESGDYVKSRSRSYFLLSKQYIRYLFLILFWNLLILGIIISIAFVLSFFTFFLVKLLLPASIDYTFALKAVQIILAAIFYLYGMFSIPLSFSYLSALYFSRCLEKDSTLPSYESGTLSKKHLHYSRILLACVLCASIVIAGYSGISKFLPATQNIFAHTQITAHRGDSTSAPENTIPAFENAIEHLADCAELDVAQTKDGIIVVMHDSNLKRITGDNINIWELTYEELMTYDAGKWFDESYIGTHFPTLDEVLKTCKYHIDLNIELKPTGHEVDYEAAVLDVIYENNFEFNCVIASSNINSLVRVKELTSIIPTIYIMPIAYGNFEEMDFADGFSIEASSITKTLVSQIHDSGKVIYAWTVNDERRINQMLYLGVDSIVTDSPIRARNIQDTQTMNRLLSSSIRELFP